MRRGLVVFVLVLAAASADAQLALRFEEQAVSATGISPGGSSVWLAVSLEQPEVYVRLVTRRQVLTDPDRDGEAIFEVLPVVPPRSAWIVVDVESGQVALGAPEGGRLRQRPMPEGAIHRLKGEGLDAVTVDGRRLEVLLVRPGVGAWGGRLGDGGPLDRDGLGDGKVALALVDLPNLAGGERAPTTLEKGDVFAVVNRETLDLISYVHGEGR